MVSRPPPIRPITRQAMLIAAYTPNARVRGGPSGKVVVISDSAAGATSAPAPWMARAVSKKACEVANPPASEAAENSSSPGDEHLAAAEQVPGPAAEQQQPAEGQRVGVDHPFQARPRKSRAPAGCAAGRR